MVIMFFVYVLSAYNFGRIRIKNIYTTFIIAYKQTLCVRMTYIVDVEGSVTNHFSIEFKILIKDYHFIFLYHKRKGLQ